MKYAIKIPSIIILLICTISMVNGQNYNKAPLREMIDSSENLIVGTVVKIETPRSSTREQLMEFAKRSELPLGVGKCERIATVKVIDLIAGEMESGTIYIPYHVDSYWEIPGFTVNDTVLLFLNPLGPDQFYGKTNPTFGVKTEHISLYLQEIEAYLSFCDFPMQSRKELTIDWLIKLSAIPELSWDGTFDLYSIRGVDYNNSRKTLLRKAILELDVLEYRNKELIDLVAGFGYDQELIMLYIKNLERCLTNGDVEYFAHLLMKGINTMDPRRRYDKLIKRHYDIYLQPEKKKVRQIISKFIEEVMMHNA